MNRNRVEQIMEYVKGSPENMNYGRWGALNPEQRKIIKELCNSWLILDEATNIQTKEIERLQSIIKEVREYIETKWKKDSYFEDIDNCLQFCSFNEFEKEDLLEILDKGE